MTHKLNPNYPLTPEDINQLIDNIRSITKLPSETAYRLLATANELQQLFPAHLGWASSKTVSKLLLQRGLSYSQIEGGIRKFVIPLGSEALSSLSNRPDLDIRHKSSVSYADATGLEAALRSLLADDNRHLVPLDYPALRKAFPHVIGNSTDHKMTGILNRLSGIRMRGEDGKWRFIVSLTDEANAVYQRQLAIMSKEA